MKTITTNTDVYEFRELPPEAQKRAVSDIQNDERYLDYPWHEYIIENFIEEKLKPEGWNTDEKDVYYSGFWSQGDGACFEGSLDVQKYLEHHKLIEKYPLCYYLACNGPAIYGKIHKNSYGNHYSHERTRYFELESESFDSYIVVEGLLKAEEEDRFNKEFKALEEDIEDSRLTHSHTLYRDLEAEYEHLNSDESIIDHIISNDYQFLINGKQY